ncbi:MAG TPA: hypothetical protein VFW78_00975 [Bacteroidia bacterium]|nr:hypothetical protein [Bacteroidia bacterium]
MKTIATVCIALLMCSTSFAQQNVKQELTDIRARVDNMVKALNEIKTNTNRMSKLFDNAGGKLDMLTSGDLLSPEMIENLTQAIENIKEHVAEASAGMKTFSGPDGRCGPGSPCFKFKRDITSTFNEMGELKSTLLMKENDNLRVLDELSELVNKAKGGALYPVYVAINPFLTIINENIKKLSDNTKELMAFSKMDDGTNKPASPFNRPGMRRGPSSDEVANDIELSQPESAITDNYFSAFNTSKTLSYGVQKKTAVFDTLPNYLNIDTTFTTIELNWLCEKDRSALGKTINGTRIVLNYLLVCSKFLEASTDKEVEGGASVAAEVSVAIKANPEKRFGMLLEAFVTITEQLLDFSSGNVDKCDYLQSQKIIADNQQTILNNQKILFEMLSNK